MNQYTDGPRMGTEDSVQLSASKVSRIEGPKIPLIDSVMPSSRQRATKCHESLPYRGPDDSTDCFSDAYLQVTSRDRASSGIGASACTSCIRLPAAASLACHQRAIDCQTRALCCILTALNSKLRPPIPTSCPRIGRPLPRTNAVFCVLRQRVVFSEPQPCSCSSGGMSSPSLFGRGEHRHCPTVDATMYIPVGQFRPVAHTVVDSNELFGCRCAAAAESERMFRARH